MAEQVNTQVPPLFYQYKFKLMIRVNGFMKHLLLRLFFPLPF